MAGHVFLVGFLLSFTLFVVILFLIKRRYGSRVATVTFTLALIFACVSIMLARYSFGPDETLEAYNEETAYPAEEWRRVLSTEELPEGFDFRPGQGLFLITSSREVRLTEVVPGCSTDSGVATSYRNSLSPQPIVEVSQPEIRLPDPPGSPLLHIYFDIPIQNAVEVDTITLGASGYAAYRNGEIWCTERHVQRGPTVGVALAFKTAIRTMLTFVFFLPIGAIVLAVSLELWRRLHSATTHSSLRT